MTLDEIKEGIADIISHPENADTFVEKLNTELVTPLDVATSKIEEQDKELKSNEKTIRAYVDKTLLGRKIEQPETKEEKKPGIDWEKFFTTEKDENEEAK